MAVSRYGFKVHEIAKGHELTAAKRDHVLRLIERWIGEQVNSAYADAHQATLRHRSGR